MFEHTPGALGSTSLGTEGAPSLLLQKEERPKEGGGTEACMDVEAKLKQEKGVRERDKRGRGERSDRVRGGRGGGGGGGGGGGEGGNGFFFFFFFFWIVRP